VESRTLYVGGLRYVFIQYNTVHNVDPNTTFSPLLCNTRSTLGYCIQESKKCLWPHSSQAQLWCSVYKGQGLCITGEV